MNFTEILTHWYSENKRDLPWRKTQNPYLIWICEVIFQQTRINQGIEYYNRFVERFPDVFSLAEASEDEVLKYWEGLGYYSRARNLHFSAQYIVNELQGKFPHTYKEIMLLKGVGDYTASAIASICFNEKTPAIDGNALRVYARLFNSFLNITASSTAKEFKAKILPHLPKNAGDFNQAVMELGALICTPKNPDCQNCPIINNCLSFQNNTVSELPFKEKKVNVKNENLHYVLAIKENRVGVRQRKEKGIWRGLYELIPSSGKTPEFRKLCTKKHKLTHKNLNIYFYESTEIQYFEDNTEMQWVSMEKLETLAFPKPIKEFLLTFVLQKQT